MPAWQALSDAWTTQVADLAERPDLTVLVTPGAGHGSPACYTPADATIEINADHITLDPATIDPTDDASRQLYPVGWGLLVHEAAHARHSHWGFGDPSNPMATRAAVMLDEARIEAQHLRRRPADRPFLHAVTTKLITAEITADDNVWTAAAAAALLLARADATVLDHTEVRGVRKSIENILGRRRLKRLETIWRRALRTRDDDTAAMMEWGHRWVRTLGLHPSIPFPLPSGGGSLVAAVGALLDAIADQLAADTGQALAARAAAARAAMRDAELQRRAEAEQAGNTVFGSPTAGIWARAPQGHTRPATEAERSSARQLSRALKAAAYREPVTTRVTSPTPPGRLNARAAMSGHVQRQLGQNPTTEPWSHNQRRTVPQPPLLVAIALDVSRSMAGFLRPAASTAWILSQAVSHVPDGASALVTFGSYVTAITHPGKPSADVREVPLERSTTGFCTTIDALDHKLGLSRRDHAARLLVIISDGYLPHSDIPTGQAQLDRLARSGCGLLWIGPVNSAPLTGTEVLLLDDATHAGPAIAAAATKALSSRN
ncbi:vWA domain-containing protein [Longispora fulva]|uniref:VWA domain-containing protein n=1 Tax=Longispora fulva TaxID=619741 RepID=A0A8J7KFI1_9ACTN|nr:vWA domain-containing protein [Longispora fulva]MBG6136215.1 hypothetical protein [Longispora fulva]